MHDADKSYVYAEFPNTASSKAVMAFSGIFGLAAWSGLSTCSDREQRDYWSECKIVHIFAKQISLQWAVQDKIATYASHSRKKVFNIFQGEHAGLMTASPFAIYSTNSATQIPNSLVQCHHLQFPPQIPPHRLITLLRDRYLWFCSRCLHARG